MKKNIKLFGLLFLIGVLIFSGTVNVFAMPDRKPKNINIQEEEGLGDEEEKNMEIEIPDDYKKVGFPSGEVGVKEVIFEDEQFKIELISIKYGEKTVDTFFDVTNKSDQDVYFDIYDFLVNGVSSYKYVTGPSIISSKMKGRYGVFITYYTLDLIGIKNINTVSFKYSVFDNYESIISKYVDGKTTLPEDKNPLEEKGKLLYEDENIQIYNFGFSPDNNYLIYVANKTGNEINISLRGLELDGYLVPSYFYITLDSEVKALSEIYTEEHTLKAIKLKDMKEAKTAEISFSIFNSEYEELSTIDFIKLK